MKKSFSLSLLILLLNLGVSIPIYASASCMNPRCHSVGYGFCLPGSQISFRKECGIYSCLYNLDLYEKENSYYLYVGVLFRLFKYQALWECIL